MIEAIQLIEAIQRAPEWIVDGDNYREAKPTLHFRRSPLYISDFESTLVPPR
jgi:hypothetical protein